MSSRRRTTFSWIAGAIVLVVLLGIGANALSNSRRTQLFGELIQRVETTDKVVALTFDDGPTPDDTEAVLKILNDKNVTGTFFLTGRSMYRHPVQTKLIVDAGHQVGNHSWNHNHMWFVNPQEVRDELDDTDKLIRASGYKGSIDFRPPYGKKLVVLPWVLNERGTRTITWDVAPEDFYDETQTPKLLHDIVMDTVRPGSIILLHPMNGRTKTQEATALIIDSLRKDGYRFVTVEELASGQ